MLIEFNPTITPINFLDTFFNLRMKGITPILAHPERYRFIQNDVKELGKMRNLDVLFQIDAGSLIGHFGDRVTSAAFSMLNEGFCDFIGSDAHNNRNRNFCIQEAYQLLSNLDNSIVDRLVYNASCITAGRGNLKKIKLEKMNFFRKFKNKLFKA